MWLAAWMWITKTTLIKIKKQWTNGKAFPINLKSDDATQLWIWERKPTWCFGSSLLGDVRHTPVIRQSVIKRENPALRIHNAIPCDLVFTAGVVNVCVCACTTQWPAHKLICLHNAYMTGSVPHTFFFPEAPVTVRARAPASCRLCCSENIPDIFCGLGAVGVGDRRCFYFNKALVERPV